MTVRTINLGNVVNDGLSNIWQRVSWLGDFKGLII